VYEVGFIEICDLKNMKVIKVILLTKKLLMKNSWD